MISYKEAFVDDASKSLWFHSLLFSIVMEFANNGDLAYRIEDKKKKN